MGGLIIRPVCWSPLFLCPQISEHHPGSVSDTGFCIIGFLDDYLKVVLEDPLSASKQKMLGQIIVTTIFWRIS